MTPSAGGAVAESIGVLTFGHGNSVITETANVGFQSNLVAASLARSNQGTALIRGTSLGTAAAAGISTVAFTAAPTFVGAGAAGTTTKGIVPYVLVDSSVTGLGTSFAARPIGAASDILRPLNTGTEMVTNAFTTGANVRLTSAPAAIAVSTAINSLTMNTGAGISINPLTILTNTSGGFLATDDATISGGVLSSGRG